jgi:hypothetical protein
MEGDIMPVLAEPDKPEAVSSGVEPAYTAPLGLGALTYLATEGIAADRTFSSRSATLHDYRFDVGLKPLGETVERFRQWEAGEMVRQDDRLSLMISPFSSGISAAEITAAAENYAKHLGLYGALVLTKTLVHEQFSSMEALTVDVKEDPDEGGYATICFAITIQESVDRVLELEDALYDMLYDRLPPDALFYFSFTYRFE